MAERGAYRSIKVVLLDGPDFQRLSERARHAFLVLKMGVGPSGLEVRYPGALEHEVGQRTGMPVGAARAAIEELESNGWIRHEGNLLWVIGQLEHDPGLQASNKNHRQSIQNHIASLPRVPLVADFVDTHPSWFPPSEYSLPDGIRMASGSHPDRANDVENSPGDATAITEDRVPSNEDRVTKTEDGETTSPNGNGAHSTDVEDFSGEESSGADPPAEWMHGVWQEVLGYDSHPLELTTTRKQKYEAMYREQLAELPDPEAAWRAVLYAVTQSEHHMSNRSYQMPESLLVNPERRSRWVQQTISVLEDGGRDVDRKYQRQEEELLEYLQRRKAS